MTNRLMVYAVLFNVVLPCVGMENKETIENHKDLVAAVKKIDYRVGEILSDSHYNLIDVAEEFRKYGSKIQFGTTAARRKMVLPEIKNYLSDFNVLCKSVGVLVEHIRGMDGVPATSKNECVKFINDAMTASKEKVYSIGRELVGKLMVWNGGINVWDDEIDKLLKGEVIGRDEHESFLNLISNIERVDRQVSEVLLSQDEYNAYGALDDLKVVQKGVSGCWKDVYSHWKEKAVQQVKKLYSFGVERKHNAYGFFNLLESLNGFEECHGMIAEHLNAKDQYQYEDQYRDLCSKILSAVGVEKNEHSRIFTTADINVYSGVRPHNELVSVVREINNTIGEMLNDDQYNVSDVALALDGGKLYLNLSKDSSPETKNNVMQHLKEVLELYKERRANVVELLHRIMGSGDLTFASKVRCWIKIRAAFESSEDKIRHNSSSILERFIDDSNVVWDFINNYFPPLNY